MSNIQFAWDSKKAARNLRKHRISFEEAQRVFLDDGGMLQEDPDYSKGEERFVLLGRSARSNVLVVCHCYRQSDEVIRIISARRATKREEATYWSAQ